MPTTLAPARAPGILRQSVFLFVLALAFGAGGCRPNQPAKPPPAVNGDANPKKDPLPDDPAAKEARAAAGEMLDRLLAGKLTEAESPLQRRAEALKGFRSWSIEAQRQDGVRVSFDGRLTGPTGNARFNMVLAKQTDGTWAVGSFSGPNPVD
jgi:hypothetical protein